jgi:hypothetical protein
MQPLATNKDFDCTHLWNRFKLAHAIIFPHDIAPLSSLIIIDFDVNG